MGLDYLFDRIPSVRWCLPVTQHTAGNLLAQTAAQLESFSAWHGSAAQGTVTVAICAGQYHMRGARRNLCHALCPPGELRRWSSGMLIRVLRKFVRLIWRVIGGLKLPPEQEG